MLSHITIGATDMATARCFYDPLLQRLGLVLKFGDDHWAAWKQPRAERPLFIVMLPFDGAPASIGNGQMIALSAATRAMVADCHAIALANGGSDEGAPGLRPHYHEQYYGAYFRDPSGNKLCVCCHAAE